MKLVVLLLVCLLIQTSVSSKCYSFSVGQRLCDERDDSDGLVKVSAENRGPRGPRGTSCIATAKGKAMMARIEGHDKYIEHLRAVIEELKLNKGKGVVRGHGRGCKEILKDNPNAKDGLYTITDGDGESMEVTCDMTTDGGGWIVFQRRFDGSTDFKQTYSSYVEGFGDPHKEFWLGLTKLHQLTKYGSWDLRVDLQDYHGQIRYAQYTNFLVREGPGFRIRLDEYSGTAGDALGVARGMKFSSYDRDQDNLVAHNCAITYQGAFWFNGCHHANPNSFAYGNREHGSGKNMLWDGFGAHNTPMKKTFMKLRPR